MKIKDVGTPALLVLGCLPLVLAVIFWPKHPAGTDAIEVPKKIDSSVPGPSVSGSSTDIARGNAATKTECSAADREQLQKNLIGRWQFFSGGKRMCHGELFKADGSFISFDKDCAIKALAPDSEERGQWSVDAKCKVQQVFNKQTKNLVGQKGRTATMTPIFDGQSRFSFKETFLDGKTYYQRE